MSAPEETVADDVAGAVKTYLVAGKIGFAECLIASRKTDNSLLLSRWTSLSWQSFLRLL